SRTDYTVSGPFSPIGITATPFAPGKAVSLAVSGNNGTSILLGHGDGTFASRGNYAPSGTTIANGDFDRDGKRDLVIVGVALLYGDGKGNSLAAHDLVVGDTPTDAAAGDFNEDGKPDLAVANSDGSTISVLLGDTHGHFLAGTQYPAGTASSSVRSGDLNG